MWEHGSFKQFWAVGWALLVLRILTKEYYDDLVRISGELVSVKNNDLHFLRKIITDDETWCFL
jgi:hypothetical protein